MLNLRYSNKFKKDFKLVQKRGYKIDKLKEVITILREQKSLPEKYQDHALMGNYVGFRECHIEPDWLLIYKIENDDYC